jgi:hypothetical protein
VTEADLRRAAGAIGALIETIRRGEVQASPTMLHRLEGAQLVLEALASGEEAPAVLIARLEETAG